MKDSGSITRVETVAKVKARQKAMVEQAVKELLALEDKSRAAHKENRS